MKRNLPVTSFERFLEPGKPIVTRTDLAGRIVYANESFVRVSGFSRDELIGASHNIVRHPDMPPEAFADLWSTLKAGLPWRGMVKNRSSSGDYYWVEAYVTPVTRSGDVVGYMSVRNAPDRQEVAAAEALYADIRAGRAVFPVTRRARSGLAPAQTLWGLCSAVILACVLTAVLPHPAAWAAASAAAVMAVALAGWVHSRLLREFERARAAVVAIDEGRVDERIAVSAGPGYALLVQLEGLRIHLRAMFADVLVGASDVQLRTESLTTALHDLAKASAQQTERVAQVAAAMEDVSVSVTEISENNTLSVAAVGRTAQVAATAMSAMRDNISSSAEVVEAVRRTQAQIGEVSLSVQKISEVTRIIRDIAEQTNLLALNAAIEAARAGDQGRGFAVVADEVRKLAERTASSTQHIASAVAEIFDRTARAVAAMDGAAADVLRSSSAIETSSHDFIAIQEASGDAGRLSEEISGMLGRQSASASEVALNMERFLVTVHAGDDNIQIIGDAAQQLRGTVHELNLLVRHLKSAL
ncbi:MAG: methyl-accepting chemotaxis protein [Pseudomonadota bacterium]|nr:methyl-accepting chemotaxis protein [Pseudomonadota bacterium]